MNQFNQTIISLITPPLMGAIAVIRLSGDDCLEITEKFFSRKIDKPRYAYFGEIRNGKETIDQVVLVYYKGPNSFTGEDVIEISCHGSMLIAQEIISLFVSAGVRLAERGEFSSRAFYHGKIDLVQAEAINSLIQIKLYHNDIYMQVLSARAVLFVAADDFRVSRIDDIRFQNQIADGRCGNFTAQRIFHAVNGI